jgi:hypothetical protein
MDNIEKLIIAAIICLLLSIPMSAWFGAKMESETYNKLTGAETTTFDALWVELRVSD